MPAVEIDGARIYYEERGTGPAMLLIAGTGGHTGTFSELAPILAKTHRVVSYDRRAFSRTGGAPPSRPYVRRHANDAVALLRAIGAAPAVLFGWSFGGIVALATALQEADVVERLILYEPPLHARKHMTFAMARAIGGAIVLGKVGLHRRAAARFFRWALSHRDGRDALAGLEPAMRESFLANARSVVSELEAGTGEEITSDDLRRLNCPIGYIVGGRSQTVFEDAAARFCAAVPATRMVHVPEGDHIMNIRQPELLAGAIRDAMSVPIQHSVA